MTPVTDPKAIRKALMAATMLHQGAHYARGGTTIISHGQKVLHPAAEETSNPTRLKFNAEGPGGVKGIVVPRHVWEGGNGAKGTRIPGMEEINHARAEVYGHEPRAPLNVGQIERVHRAALEEHFRKPLPQQVAAENSALERLRAAKHLSMGADTLDESEKLDTVRHEHDAQGRSHVGYAAKGTAGHALYAEGAGPSAKLHVLNTCPGQTSGCGGGVDKNGVVDTRRGMCFAPKAEAQYPGAAVKRASQEQAKHDPAMTKDWILAHTGSLRKASARADKKNEVTLFRPNVVDETDKSSRHVIRGLNKQRAAQGLPHIVANSYGKTNELHDPENGYFVTHSNVGPKTKHGTSISENISRDKQRVRSTILAQDASGRHFMNEEGHQTPPKNSYAVTDVERGSDMDKALQGVITHAKYWSTGRNAAELSPAERAEGPEGHFGPTGEATTPDLAHFGHTTVNGNRYDYQKQHILHPRMVAVRDNKKGVEHLIPTDSRFKDEEFLPKDRFMSKSGKKAGAILLTTPTISTSGLERQASFTHHIGHEHLEHAREHHGEYEIDPPHAQEAARGLEYEPPKTTAQGFAHGGAVDHEHDDEGREFPSLSWATMRHNAHSSGMGDPDSPRGRFASGGQVEERHKLPALTIGPRMRASILKNGFKAYSTGGAVDDVGKTIPESPMQPERQLTPQGLYSQGAEAARALPQAKGTPDQMLASLKGVKPQEIEQSGFGRWAHGKKHVTRDEMAQRFEHGLPQIEETVLGKKSPSYPHQTSDDWSSAIHREERRGNWDEAERLGNAWEEQQGVGGAGAPKFERWTIPGGENYREVLMHLPEHRNRVAREDVEKTAREIMTRDFSRPNHGYTDEEQRTMLADPLAWLAGYEALKHHGLPQHPVGSYDAGTQ